MNVNNSNMNGGKRSASPENINMEQQMRGIPPRKRSHPIGPSSSLTDLRKPNHEMFNVSNHFFFVFYVFYVFFCAFVLGVDVTPTY